MGFSAATFLRLYLILTFFCILLLTRRSLYLSASLMADKEVQKPRLYTKTGDKGTSSLFTGERRSKSDCRFEALGATDELSSAIGLAREFVTCDKIDNQLEHIQCCLQDLQAVLATPEKTARDAHLVRVEWDAAHLTDVERWTDEHTQELPTLKNFILPVRTIKLN